MNHKEPLCRSVFKSGEGETTAQHVTQIWTALINQMEKSKGSITASR